MQKPTFTHLWGSIIQGLSLWRFFSLFPLPFLFSLYRWCTLRHKLTLTQSDEKNDYRLFLWISSQDHIKELDRNEPCQISCVLNNSMKEYRDKDCQSEFQRYVLMLRLYLCKTQSEYWVCRKTRLAFRMMAAMTAVDKPSGAIEVSVFLAPAPASIHPSTCSSTQLIKDKWLIYAMTTYFICQAHLHVDWDLRTNDS